MACLPLLRVAATFGVALFLSAPVRAEVAATNTAAASKTPACVVSGSASPLDRGLRRVSEALQRGKPVTIVAVGSSSTAGAGASSPTASYPSRLEALLKQQFPRAQLRVINRGVNGEEAEEMLARFEREVIAERPDLVLWQVGTNAILRDFARSAEAKLIRRGIARLKATGADVVLVDPQYVPAVLAKTDAELMVDLVAVEAREAGAAVFRRFDLMRDWHETERLPFTAFVSGDGLHMNDWGYDCMARNLAAQIAEAAAVPAVASASASVGR